MPKPVKDEIFGTRKSRLKERLAFDVYENLFFATCVKRINANPATRYILLNECHSEKEFQDDSFSRVIPFFHHGLRVGNVFWQENRIHIRSLRSDTSRTFSAPDELAKFLLKLLQCDGGAPLTPSSARVIDNEEVSPLSRFLRTGMYGRVASTDIDFMIVHDARESLILIEEKLYVQGGGSIGHGQYLSFREMVIDGFSPEKLAKIRFYLLFIPEPSSDECYLYDFMQERTLSVRYPSHFDPRRKEQRIVIPYNELQKTTISEFLGKWVMW